jgi:hypothetical protein
MSERTQVFQINLKMPMGFILVRAFQKIKNLTLYLTLLILVLWFCWF